MNKLTQVLLILIVFLSFSTIADEAPNKTTKTIFTVYEVKIDSGAKKLVAWQLELNYDKEKIKIVGIEGGTSKAFPAAKPPSYDQKGLTAGKIILANFSTEMNKLESGRQIVARIHVMQPQNLAKPIQLKKTVVANENGQKFQAPITLTRMEKRK